MVCWRMVWAVLVAEGGCVPVWVPDRQGGRAAPPGLAVLSVAARGRGDGLPGMAGRRRSGGDLLRQFGGI